MPRYDDDLRGPSFRMGVHIEKSAYQGWGDWAAVPCIYVVDYGLSEYQRAKGGILKVERMGASSEDVGRF